MGKIALVVGGTGMAGYGVIPHLLNQANGKYDAAICLARTVDETTFASRTKRNYIAMPCNLDDKKAVIEALVKDTVFSPSKLRDFGFRVDRIYEYDNGAKGMTTFFQRLVDESMIPDPATVVPAD